jgi:glycerophosphoryl diester phosphodiesterase
MVLDQVGTRLVIAHRGASGHAPENTIAALRLAVDQGADAIEFDIRLSACDTPVLAHDPTLDRTTSWTGPVRSRTAVELAQCDAGHRFTPDGGSFPWRGRGLGIPSLERVLTEFPEIPLLIELKTVEVAFPALEVLRRFGAKGRVMVASFLDHALVPFRLAGFLTSASRRGIFQLWALSRIGLRAPTKDQAYSVPERYRNWITVPDQAFIRAAASGGRPVHVWTVNERGKARELWNRGVTGIITNFPAAIMEERGTLSEPLRGPDRPAGPSD